MAGAVPAAPGRIFISYRRDETDFPAGWLYDRLATHFGRDQIFKDIDSIELGDDFVEVITRAVGSCDVLLALIGDRWLSITDENGKRRLDDPNDFVRLEIEAALERQVRLIPILVGNARMPRPEQLPPSLAKLARRQALQLSPVRFESDTGRLLGVLERSLEESRREAEERPRPLHQAAVVQPTEERTKRDTRTQISSVAAQAARRAAGLALATAQAITDYDWGRAYALADVAEALARAGDTDQALAVAQAITDAQSRAYALAVVAGVLAEAGDTGQALTIAQMAPDGRWRAQALTRVAGALVQAGQTESARHLADQALTAAQAITDDLGRAYALASVARTLAEAGQTESARRAADQALTAAQAITSDWLRASTLAEIAGALIQPYR
jgi:tetratricopeptide (TPR) repeat protein